MNVNTYSNLLQDDKLTIFLLHGVIKNNPFQVRNHNHKHILAHDFENLLEKLCLTGNSFSIQDLAQHKPIPPRAFVMTFDDGFENNYSVAAPLLRKFKVPAIYYVTSGFIEHNLMSWVDQIDHAIENTNRSEINIAGINQPISLRTREEKIKALDQIRMVAKSDKQWFSNKELHIAEISEACEVNPVQSLDSPIDQKMSWAQVRELSLDPLFQIGGHTHTHAIMSFLNHKDLQFEISHCLNLIGSSGAKFHGHFSYPEGSLLSYNSNVIHELKKQGIVCSPTAIEGQNSFNEDLFHLKRINVT